ncbi:DUF1905 domain-containing protein [Agromyces sp. MMS24-JH15]|uniref:DUF1905 domain-containing protein n=1 Tax=Agromyces sp. MMS24-JH15 TaxID=3243765 RepID=UPI00374788A0
MDLNFRGTIWYWRGPAPFHFVTVPVAESETIAEVSPAVTYGWGMVPVSARIGDSTWTTALWPKDGGYILPVKASVRAGEGVDVDDVVEVRMSIAI